MPMMKAYEREHLKLLEGILTQLTRIADAIEGDRLEPEEVYSEETLSNLKTACNSSVPPGVVRDLEEKLSKISDPLADFPFTH